MKVPIARMVIRRWRAISAPILARVCDATGKPRFWQKGGGFDRNVRTTTEFSREVRYIHRNPVERGLVDEAGDWRWSSVRWWRGVRESEFECDPPPWGDWSQWKGFE